MLGTFQHVYPVVQSNASLLTEQMTGRNNRVGVRLAFRVPTHTHTQYHNRIRTLLNNYVALVICELIKPFEYPFLYPSTIENAQQRAH